MALILSELSPICIRIVTQHNHPPPPCIVYTVVTSQYSTSDAWHLLKNYTPQEIGFSRQISGDLFQLQAGFGSRLEILFHIAQFVDINY